MCTTRSWVQILSSHNVSVIMTVISKCKRKKKKINGNTIFYSSKKKDIIRKNKDQVWNVVLSFTRA